MKQEELNEIIENHLHWIMEDIDGWENMRADLYGANLSSADLSRADLSRANLSRANLSRADLSSANLSRANLYGADLSRADLSGANLSSANLYGANLSRADLSRADLSGANLSSAYHLDEAKGLFLPTVCPSDGEFTAWKKCRDGAVVKLLIPDTALRSSASGRKCRASEAVVLTIYDKDGNEINEARSGHDSDFVYRVGETVKPVQEFDTNRWNECATGIHFFVTREEAERYEQ